MAQIALVTGGNRGIGLAVCEGLAKLGMHVLMGSRDLAKGDSAASTLRQKGLSVEAIQLDVTDPASIEKSRQTVSEKQGRLDVLVNNAAIMIDENSNIMRLPIDTLRETMEANFFGPFRMCQTFLPMMQQQRYGRVVNVSSQAGQLSTMGNYAPAYSISKTALNALTVMFGAAIQGDIKMNAMCPGWVRTDMGGPNAHRSPDQGAETILWLATLPADGPTGGFFRDQKPLAW